MTARPLTDVRKEGDIHAVVLAFYTGIETDPWLGRFFDGVDWGAHLPTMVRFWSAVVFQTGTYRGQPLEAHARLDGLTPYHFDRWLDRFRATVDARFLGPNADRMKERAEQIAGVMQVKLLVPRTTSGRT
jgi:hemoglobin